MKKLTFTGYATLLLFFIFTSYSYADMGKVVDSNAKVQKEAKKQNVTIVSTPPAPVIDLTGPSPDWTKEVLMGLFANKNELSIRVRSGGCTKKKDFWIWCSYDETSKGKVPHYVLTIYRMKKDECKAFTPSGVLIEFNLREKLGLPYLFTYSVTNRVKVGVSSNK